MFRKIIGRFIPKTIKRNISAKRLANTSKRLDLCAAQFANMLHLSDISSLKNKVCLEIGSGWVLSHALICHLIGAEKVYVSDIEPLAYPPSLNYAVRNSEKSIIRDILSPFFPHDQIRKRLDNVCEVKHFSLENLKNFGIEYIAPVDLAKESPNFKADFIYSFSVLEHVPVEDIFPLLSNLINTLNNDGSMIHCIHLEDHKNITGDPFCFLTEPDASYDRVKQNLRGNRLRGSQWLKLFKCLNGTDFRVIYQWKRYDKKLPEEIDKSISFIDVEDLRTSHLGIYVTKR